MIMTRSEIKIWKPRATVMATGVKNTGYVPGVPPEPLTGAEYAVDMVGVVEVECSAVLLLVVQLSRWITDNQTEFKQN